MAEWIVIIALSQNTSMNLSVPANIPGFTPSIGSIPAIYHTPPPPPPPVITVVRAKSLAEAEAQARGCYIKDGATWTDDRIVAPAFFPTATSRAVVIITPDGRVWRVESVEKKKKVVREVEESDGWEMRWTEEAQR